MHRQTDENGFWNVLIGWAKVNVNRSFSTSDGAAGIGVVIRDHDGSSWRAVQYPVQRKWKLE
uniref:RNase H type-1 domain-containing protein n=1 Tax=Oryza meridionalis TaxID=40149 RepID=A0A0E0D2E3_9ORYZ